MERQKERIAHYWGQRSEGFRQAHQGEWEDDKEENHETR